MRRLEKLPAWLAIGLACCVILAFSSLIPGGRWDVDEFQLVAMFHAQGAGYFLFRFVTWSPRPLSEVVLWAYAIVVDRTGWPLVAPFLILTWMVLIVAALCAAPRRTSGRPWWLAMSLSLVAFFFLAPDIKEVFYWPMGAAAYLPLLAALLLAAFWMAAGAAETPCGRWLMSGALIAGSLSVEPGLFVAAGFAASALAFDLLTPSGISRRQVLTRGVWYLLPVTPGVMITGLLFLYRAGNPALNVSPTDVYFHHIGPSLGAAISAFVYEARHAGSALESSRVYVSLAVETLAFLGFHACLSSVPRGGTRARLPAALAIGLASAMYLTIAASFYQYGGWGFGRHRTLFHCLFFLVLFNLAHAAAAIVPLPVGFARWSGPLASSRGSC